MNTPILCFHPPIGTPVSGGGSGIDLSLYARLDLPNVFQRETTFSGIRLGDIQVITSDYSVLATDGIILVDCSGGGVTITLPSSVGTGQAIWILKTDSTNNAAVVQAASGDTIESFPSISLTDPISGVMVCDVENHLWNMMISPYLADTTVQNTFTQATTLNGLQLGDPKTVTAGTWSLSDTDGVVLADASLGDVTILLPLAVSENDPTLGSGQLYFIRKDDSTGHLVTVQAQAGDDIDGNTSLSFQTPGQDGFFISAGPTRWCNPGGVLPDIVPQTDLPWWNRPDIDNKAELAVFPTMGNPINSRIDVVFPDGFHVYYLQPLAADPADPGMVAPNDYDPVENNVHWQQAL